MNSISTNQNIYIITNKYSQALTKDLNFANINDPEIVTYSTPEDALKNAIGNQEAITSLPYTYTPEHPNHHLVVCQLTQNDFIEIVTVDSLEKMQKEWERYTTTTFPEIPRSTIPLDTLQYQVFVLPTLKELMAIPNAEEPEGIPIHKRMLDDKNQLSYDFAAVFKNPADALSTAENAKKIHNIDFAITAFNINPQSVEFTEYLLTTSKPTETMKEWHQKITPIYPELSIPENKALKQQQNPLDVFNLAGENQPKDPFEIKEDHNNDTEFDFGPR